MTLSVVRSNSGKSTHSLRPLPIVAIDGPAGAGKSTAARMLAAHLGFILIDTGAIYRCLAHKAIDQNISLQDETQLVLLCSQIQITFGRLEKNFGGGEEGLTVPTQKIYCNEIDMSELIRSPEMSLAASLVSKHPGVREALMKMQRDFGEKGGIVMEGRDIGTVIFPDAEVKFFLTADVKSRAQRRYSELSAQGLECSLEKILTETQQRDRQDSERETAPLKKADDATEIDSSDLPLDQVVAKMSQIVRSHLKES